MSSSRIRLFYSLLEFVHSMAEIPEILDILEMPETMDNPEYALTPLAEFEERLSEKLCFLAVPKSVSWICHFSFNTILAGLISLCTT